MSKKQPNPILNIFKRSNKDTDLNEKDIPKNIPELLKDAHEAFKNKDLDKSEKYFSLILEANPNHLEAIYTLAKVNIAKNNYNDAISLLKKYLNEEPNSFDAKLRLANSYIKIKEFEQAISLLNQLRNTQNDPKKNEKATVALARAYYSQGNFFKNKEKYKEALDSYEQASKFENEQEKYLYYTGLCYKDMQKYSKAVEVFKSALKLHENIKEKKYNFEIYFHLGDIEEKQNNIGRAINIYQRFIDLNPSSNDKYFFFAKIKLLQKDYELSIENFNKALEAKEHVTEVNTELAKAYMITKKYNSAFKIYQELLVEDDDNQVFLLNTAIINIRLENWYGAYEIFAKLDEDTFNKVPEALKYLGKTLFELGMVDDAAQRLLMAQNIFVDDPEISVFLCQCYRKQGNNENASRELQRILKTYPNNFLVLSELALTYKEAKDYEKALNIYKKMLGFEINRKEAYKLIADLNYENGNFKDAIDNYKKYFEDFPEDPEAIYNLGICYFSIVKINKAVKEFEKIINNKKFGFAASSFLTDIYISKGDVNKACEFIQKCIEFVPDYVDGYIKYGKIYVHLGQIGRAVSYFDYAKNIAPQNEEVDNLLNYYSVNK